MTEKQTDYSSTCWFVILGTIVMNQVNADLFVVLANQLRHSPGYQGWGNFVMGYVLLMMAISIMSFFCACFLLAYRGRVRWLRPVVLMICWFVMVGNCITPVCNSALGIFEIVCPCGVPQIDPKSQIIPFIIIYLLPVFLLAIMTFRCAFILRAKILHSIEEEKADLNP